MILAGVSIAIVSGEDGIIATTKKARESTIVAQEVEKIKLAYSSASMSSKNGKASSAELRKELKSNKDDVTVTIAKSNTTDEKGKRENGIKVIYNKTGNIYFVDKNGNVIKDGSYIKEVSAVYWLVYSNNSDDSDLELVFNSTGNVDSNRKLIEKGGDISKTLFDKKTDIPYYKYAEKIKQATIEDEIAPQYTIRWFCKLSNMTKINNIENLDTSSVTNMRSMFYSCSSLTNLDLSNFNTSNVTNMRSMFYSCSNLTNLDVSNFDTRNVTDMEFMFHNCSNLQELDLSNFNTSKVVYMNHMFNISDDDPSGKKVGALKKINLSSFDTSNVIDMQYMFESQINLEELDLSSFNTLKVKNVYAMFASCGNLKKIYTSEKFDVTLAKNSTFERNGKNIPCDDIMFYGTTKIIGGNGTKYDSSKINGEYARIDKDGEPGYFTLKQ